METMGTIQECECPSFQVLIPVHCRRVHVVDSFRHFMRIHISFRSPCHVVVLAAPFLDEIEVAFGSCGVAKQVFVVTQ